MRFLSWKNMPSTSTMTACTHSFDNACKYSGGRTDEREIEVTSVAQLGSGFLLRNSRIKLHLQQWNRLNRATRAVRFLNLNLIRRLSRGVE
jgi:hypothetical protein